MEAIDERVEETEEHPRMWAEARCALWENWPDLPSGPLRLAAWHADRGTWWVLLAEVRHASNITGRPFIPTITDPAAVLAQAHAALASAYAAIAQTQETPS